MSNMIVTHQFQFEYQELKPDVLVIRGGGNDILGDIRLAGLTKF